MRLPKLADGSIDIPQTSEMVDKFLAAGVPSSGESSSD